MFCSTDAVHLRRRPGVVWRVLCGLLAFAVSAVVAAPGEDPLGRYALGPGDGIRVLVFGESDLSGDFNISTNGTVALPLVGQVQAAGRTPSELAADIVRALSPDYLRDPRVSVEVLQYRPFFILGEVKAPGSYPYAAGINVRRAAALAGGYTYRAKEGHAYITRTVDGQQSRVKVEPDTWVLPGDIIEVPERFF